MNLQTGEVADTKSAFSSSLSKQKCTWISQLFVMTSALRPIRQFAMTVSSQWSSMSWVSLWAVYDSLGESSLGVTHG